MIHEGDCLAVLPTLPAASVDMVFADLPYGTTRNAWDSLIDLPALWAELRRVAKPNAAMVFTAQAPFDKVLGVSNLREFRYEWVWEKAQATGHLNAKRMPMKAHETVLVFYRKLPTYNPQMTHGHARKVSTAEHKRDSRKSTNYGDYALASYDSTSRYPRSVIRFPTDKQKSSLHPTQKPVSLVRYLIETYTNPGATVLDPTAGVLTTAVAADECGRQSICIEREPEYIRLGQTRLPRKAA